MGDHRISRRDFTRAGLTGILGAGALGAATDEPGAAPAMHTTATWSGGWRPESPRRLSARTRELAELALSGAHGREMAYADFALPPGEPGESADLRYGRAMRLIAERAPLRVLSGERIVGSATLREAAEHRTPLVATGSVSHTTLGFHRVLTEGLDGLRRRIEERLARGGFDSLPNQFCRVDTPRGPAWGAAPGQWLEAISRPEYGRLPLVCEVDFLAQPHPSYNILIAHHYKASTRHWEIFTLPTSGELCAYVPGFSQPDVHSAARVTDGAWHTAQLELTDTRVRLRLDGGVVAEAAGTWAPANEPGGALWIGACEAGATGCLGRIARVSIGRPDGAPLAEWSLSPDPAVAAMLDGVAGNHAVPPIHYTDGADLLRGMLMCLDAAEIWRERYRTHLAGLAEASSDPAERANYLEVRDILSRVPAAPPRTFHEAVQSLWFLYAFQRLAGTWSGIGRIDEMLGPYLARDLTEGRLTLDEAREVLAHFWIKGVEWTGCNPWRGSGDAQFYQNVILAGVDAEGREVTNEVTYLVLDIVEELHISDFPIAVRLNSRSPRRLLERMADVQRHGGGIVAAYNEDVVIEGLVDFGYDVAEARSFTNDGCWEVLIPGRTTFSYAPFDALALLHETLGLQHQGPAPDFADFEALYGAWRHRLRLHLDAFHAGADGWAQGGPPCPLVSMFVDDCIERGRSYHMRGSRYTVLAPHAGGLANVADSLLALRRLVYEEQYLSLDEFIDLLRRDWTGGEHLRRLIRTRFDFYGNDDDTADAMMTRVFNDYTELAGAVGERAGVLRPVGISTFGREIEWAAGETPLRAASPDGHHRGDILATNFSPSPGSDRKGPTAAIASYCKLDFTRTPNGATIELKLHPQSVRGANGRDALVGLLRGFVRLGGFFVHVDVVDSAMLIDAQRHPERYPNLAVRISGWSARFATLNRDWQNMIIGRTQQVIG